MSKAEEILGRHLAVNVLLAIRRNEGATGACLEFALAGHSLNTIRDRLIDLERNGLIRIDDTIKRKYNEKYIYTTQYGAIVADVILGVSNLLKGGF